MKITANTSQYRVTITDPISGMKRKLSFPLHGTLTEKRQQIKEIKVYIANCKLEAKKLEARALIMEAELCRRAKHKRDLDTHKDIYEIRNKERSNPIVSLFDKYKLTDTYSKLAATSKYQREKHFYIFIDFLKTKKINDAEQIKHDHAVSFMASLGCKAGTFNKYRTNLSSIFTTLNINNPFKKISRRNEELDVEVKTPFTDSEVNKIFKSFTGDWKDICLIAAYTGMRFSDAIHLKKSNISMDFNQQRHIIKLMPGKTKHTGRSLYLQLLPPLEFLLDKKTDNKGYFFPDKVKKYKAGTKDAGKSLNHVFKKKIKALEIENKTFHCFRHYFVDKMRKAGFSDEQIGSAIGHSSTAQTRDYGDCHNPVDLSKAFKSG